MEPGNRRLLMLAPLVVFAGLALIFWRGLSGDPQRLPSTLINRQVPEFTLSGIDGMELPGLDHRDLAKGRVTLVNIFASWCGPCRDEHPLLMELAKRTDIDIVGLNNKDAPENARRFLGLLGNPYKRIGADSDGRVSIDWGGYGVPETFVVDGAGRIRHKIIGPLTPAVAQGPLENEIRKAMPIP
jgi:cytochrome c biogenesis protein CcmG, thiol:disulfide interchange protein DsbE